MSGVVLLMTGVLLEIFVIGTQSYPHAADDHQSSATASSIHGSISHTPKPQSTAGARPGAASHIEPCSYKSQEWNECAEECESVKNDTIYTLQPALLDAGRKVARR